MRFASERWQWIDLGVRQSGPLIDLEAEWRAWEARQVRHPSGSGRRLRSHRTTSVSRGFIDIGYEDEGRKLIEAEPKEGNSLRLSP